MRYGVMYYPVWRRSSKKKKPTPPYYYVVESARVEGKPRIVHQTYLGTAERVARLVQRCQRPSPALWPPPSSPACPAPSGWKRRSQASLPCFSRSGPAALRSLARSLSAVGRHPSRLPAGAQDRSGRLVSGQHSSSLWGFAPERFTSQSFLGWLRSDPHGESLPAGSHDELEEAQLKLLGLWKEKPLVTRRLLAYDTTNFYTYIASNNERIAWHSGDTTSRAGITCAKWG